MNKLIEWKPNPVVFVIVILAAVMLTGCFNYRRLLTDEIVLKDGNSHTGTITQMDSTTIRLRKVDELIKIIQWADVDTVQGKKLKTLFLGVNMGFYKTPYFSVFRNESVTPRSFGMEYKAGFALRGNRLFYLDLSYLPAKPYEITKFGFGYQYYPGASTYLKKNSFFVGTEANFMNAKFNNAAQFTFEPFTGFERKLNEQLRLHAKLGLQFNLANKNNQAGVNFTVGIHFMRRNFKKYYDSLNRNHILPRK